MWCPIERFVQISDIYGVFRRGAFGVSTTNQPKTTTLIQAPVLKEERDPLINLWYKCREEFAVVVRKYNDWYFAYGNGIIDNALSINLAKFVDIIEDRLRIEEKSRTLFQATSYKKLVNVHPGVFWKQCPLRMSLFTALLRCGLTYRDEDNNFDDALFSQPYTRYTRNAVCFFLEGNVYKKCHVANGWQYTFQAYTYTSILTNDRKQFVM